MKTMRTSHTANCPVLQQSLLCVLAKVCMVSGSTCKPRGPADRLCLAIPLARYHSSGNKHPTTPKQHCTFFWWRILIVFIRPFQLVCTFLVSDFPQRSYGWLDTLWILSNQATADPLHKLNKCTRKKPFVQADFYSCACAVGHCWNRTSPNTSCGHYVVC